MIVNKTITGILLAAGNSTRFGKNRNKNFELVHGKSIISYSLNSFDNNKYIDNIIIVIRQEDKIVIENIIKEQKIHKKVYLILGGKSRQESVYNALRNTDSNIVVIHDGARPVLKQEYINETIKKIDDFKGVTIGVKSKDTIKIADNDGIIINTTERENTWLIQTPQCFDREILLNLHEKYKNDIITDDCMLLEKGGYKVKIIEGDYNNIKVTTYSDINIIKEFL